MSAKPRRAPEPDAEATPSLALGYLAALPLFALYELALALQGETAVRASAEQVVARVLELFGRRAALVRVGLLLALAAIALLARRRAGEPAGRALARALRGAAEGILAGFLLGPVLVGLQAWLGAAPLTLAAEPARTLSWTMRLVGAAPWEELLFRVGLYGGIFLVARRASGFLGLDARLARAGAELVALLFSAVGFAFFHLDAVQRLLGSAGEPFHRGLFLWRVSAGILLGALFRWRGFGAAAWAHAVFNLGIALGIRA